MPINYKEYPPNWQETRNRILSRENHCCKFCGVENHSLVNRGQSLKPTKVVLTIAHLDHDAENWDVSDDRLAALCQRCHLRYDMPSKANKRKYGKGYKDGQGELFNHL